MYKYSLYTICHKIIIIVLERIIALTPVKMCSWSVLHCHHLRLQILIQCLLTCDKKNNKNEKSPQLRPTQKQLLLSSCFNTMSCKFSYFRYLDLFQIQTAWSHQTEQRRRSCCKCWQRQCQLEDHHSLSEPAAHEKISPSNSSYVKKNVFHLINIPSEDTRSQAIICGISSPKNTINITEREGERERETDWEGGSDRQKSQWIVVY